LPTATASHRLLAYVPQAWTLAVAVDNVNFKCRKLIMCKVYNTIGCLTVIKAHLYEHNVNEYQSINELINFQRDYTTTRQQIISDHHHIIEQESGTLNVELVKLNDSLKAARTAIKQQLISHIRNLKAQLDNISADHTNFIQAIILYVKKIWLKIKIQINKVAFNFKIANAINHLIEEHNKKNTRYQFIISNPEDAVMQSCTPQLHELDRKKNVIDQINNSIYGALGEHKVVRELEKLGNDCILINDFNCTFNPPIYNHNENYHINSVQIDHILITPAGIFLIETKNWSQHSVNNINLYSPVQQIKRANFALYRILNGDTAQDKLYLNTHHWGERKITIHNIIVLINYKPIEEFQFVKILTLNKLLGYVNYFNPCFSNEETQMLANYLLNVSTNN
jgi:hypothetical protein